MAAECYPSQTAGRCMRRWQVAVLAAFTLLLTAVWLPLRATAWAITAATHHRGHTRKPAA